MNKLPNAIYKQSKIDCLIRILKQNFIIIIIVLQKKAFFEWDGSSDILQQPIR